MFLKIVSYCYLILSLSHGQPRHDCVLVGPRFFLIQDVPGLDSESKYKSYTLLQLAKYLFSAIQDVAIRKIPFL